MIKSGFFGKARRALSSLRVRFLVVFALASAIAVALYFIMLLLGNYYIANVYTSEEERKAREKTYIEDLQEYVTSNKISSEQATEISEWARKNQYVYLLLYKNDELFYTSDYKPAPSPEPEKPSSPDEESSDTDTEESGGSSSVPEGGITVDYPTREELFEYARENGVHPLEFEDGTMLASVAEFTEYLYYDLLNIISLAAAALTIVVIMLLYIQRVTARIIHLGVDVNKVAEGDTGHVIAVKGHDEISTLATNVESMRSSMIENFEKEREAVDANNALITSMSHDIRTPLTVLLGYMDVMKAHAEGDEQMQSYIKAAESTAMRLKKLSDDMFGYFLVFGQRDTELALETFDAQMLLQQIVGEHVLLLRESGYEVKENVSELSLSANLNTDVQKLLRIVDNIFSNIHKYADKDAPVEISASIDACQIKLVFSNVIAHEREQVESNGIGLKTCKKLAELIGAEFASEISENIFYANISLQIS